MARLELVVDKIGLWECKASQSERRSRRRKLSFDPAEYIWQSFDVST